MPKNRSPWRTLARDMVWKMYKLSVKESLDRKLKKLGKKDRELLRLIDKKVKEILQDPFRFKPLKKPLQNKRRVHVGGSFVLIYEINEEKSIVTLVDFDHHDNIYKTWLWYTTTWQKYQYPALFPKLYPACPAVARSIPKDSVSYLTGVALGDGTGPSLRFKNEERNLLSYQRPASNHFYAPMNVSNCRWR